VALINDIAREFWSRMEAADQKLSLLSEEDARKPFRRDGWLRKDILGHLVDSACVNHVRFLVAATTGSYEGSGYDQNACVRLQDYAQVPWPAILDQWRARNTWIAETITNIPQESLGAICRISNNPPMRLDALILDTSPISNITSCS
jgi:hypothetical protein